MIIVLDPGHGGRDPGAVGPGGTREKDIALQVALKTRDILSQIPGLEVWLTRTKDQEVSTAARAKMANDLGADCFISIHCNAASNPAGKGMEVWTSRGQTAGDKLADQLARVLQKTFPNMFFRADWSDGDPDKEANFDVCYWTKCPAALVELGFLSNPEEEKVLQDEGYQYLAAEAIAQAAAQFLGLSLPDIQPEKPLRVEAGGKVIQCEMKGDKVWVPVRDLAESLGHRVEWYAGDRTVKIS